MFEWCLQVNDCKRGKSAKPWECTRQIWRRTNVHLSKLINSFPEKIIDMN
jgi:hypothetical protein